MIAARPLEHRSPLAEAAPALVCRCLQVTHDEVAEAVENPAIKTLRDLSRCTNAGLGCNSCHPALRAYLAQRGQCSGICDSAPSRG